jgi:hypothetical protein
VRQREWFEVAGAVVALGGAISIETEFAIFLWHPRADEMFRLGKLTVTVRTQRQMLEHFQFTEAEYFAVLER